MPDLMNNNEVLIFITVLLLILIVTIFLLIKNIRLVKKLEELASTDSLTNILNRRYFMEFSSAQIERSKRTGMESFIIIFDLDHFKSINDSYGHLAGDKVLKEISRRVKGVIRPYDLFARYGGEEFIIFMPDIDKENVIHASERIRQDICKVPIEYENRQIQVSASFGIAYAAPVNNIDKATKYADKALYMAKAEGYNKVVFYEGSND